MKWRQAYTLYKRGKYWYYRTYDERGIRTAGTSTGKTSKQLARIFCDELLKADKLGITRKVNFNHYAEEFLSDNSPFFRDRLTPLTPRTITAYRQFYKNYISPYTEGLALQDINYIKLKEHRVRLLENVSSSTVEKAFSLYSKILDQAFREGKIKENPIHRLEKMGSKVATRDAFTIDEVKFLYQNIDAEWKPIVLLLALTGMRISEARAVSEDDIKLDGDVLYIDLKQQFVKGELSQLKNKSERKIPIIPEIKGYTRQFFPEQIFYRRFVPLEKQCTDAEKRNLTIHSLRHFFVSNSKASEVNNLKVEYIVGHKLKGMEGVYTSFTVQDLKAILDWQRKTLEYITK